MPEKERNRNPQISRRTFLKKFALAATGTILLPPASLVYARYAEPHWLDIVNLELRFPRLPPAMDGLRVVQFSDVHLGFHFDADDLSKLGNTINALQPDLVCFTGDLVDFGVGPDGAAYTRALQSIHGRLGKFAVVGNHDYYDGAPKVVKLLENGGFQVLMNRAVPVEQHGGRLWVAGVDDQWHGKPNVQKAVQAVAPGEFTLLLCHCPDYADIASEHAIDLQLSGHSHGGQVRVPLYGHIVTPRFGKKYVMGLYPFDSGMQLYVNRGIGMSQQPIRFCCRPEITVFTLRRA